MKKQRKKHVEKAAAGTLRREPVARAGPGRGIRWLHQNSDMLIAAGGALFFVAHLFLTDALFLGSGTDIISLQYPVHHFAVTWMKQGVLPLWNPYIFGGVPFQAGVHGYLYPGLWTGLALPPALDIKLGIAVHLMLAAAGGAWFARGFVVAALPRAVSGLVFALSGFMMLHLFAGHRIMVMTAAYLPWVAGALYRVLDGDSRFVFKGAALLGLMALAGHYQVIFIGIFGVMLWLFLDGLCREKSPFVPLATNARSRIAGIAAMLALGIGIAAVQIAPAVSNISLSQRPGDDAVFAASFSSAPLNLITFLFPHFFGNKVDAPFVGNWSYWESLGYFGVIPLCCVIAAHGFLPWRRVLPKTVVIVLALILTLGSHTPIFKAYLTLVPGAALFRSPGRFVLLVNLFGALMTAEVLDLFYQKRLSAVSRTRFWWSICLPVAAMLAAVLWFSSWRASDFAAWWALILGRTGPFTAQNLTNLVALVERDMTAAAVYGIVAFMVFVSARKAPSFSAALAGLVTLLLVVDLYQFGHRFLKTGDESLFRLPREVTSFIARNDTPGARFIPPAETRFVNASMMAGVGTSAGYDIFLEKRFAEYLNAAASRPLDRFLSYERLRRGSRLLSYLGARYLVTTSMLQNGRNRYISGYDHFSLKKRVGSYFVYENPAASPRAFLVHRAVVLKDADARLRRLAGRDFDILDEAVLDAAMPGFSPKAPVDDRNEAVDIVSLTPNRVDLEATASGDALLVMSDTLMSGWQATVDDISVPMVPANHVMRALPLTAGRHRVVMWYLPMSFLFGAAISVLAICVLVIGRFRTARDSPR